MGLSAISHAHLTPRADLLALLTVYKIPTWSFFLLLTGISITKVLAVIKNPQANK